jgi:two-component system cell cycle response regulator
MTMVANDTWSDARADLRGVCVRALGSATSVLLGVLLIVERRSTWPPEAQGLLAIACAGAFVVAVVRRRNARSPRAAARFDFELSSLGLLLGVQGAVWLGLFGPALGALFMAFACVAAFAKPVASAASFVFLTILLMLLPDTHGDGVPERAALALSVGLTGAVVAAALRFHIERTWRAARASVERELERLRGEARSYRLMTLRGTAVVDAGESPAPRASVPDDPRLLCSSVEEIHAAFASTLSVCRIALDCRSVLMLWLDEGGATLHVRAFSSSAEEILRGPFAAKEGLFAAALDRESPLELCGASARRPLPYYPSREVAGHVAAVSIRENNRAVGLIALDRITTRALLPGEIQILEDTVRLVRRTIDNERAFLQLDRAQLEQGKLYRAVERLNEARTEAQVIEAGVTSARDFTAYQFVAVTLLGAGGEHEICAVRGPLAAELEGKKFKDATGLVGMVVANRHPLPYRGQCDPGMQVLFTRSLAAPELGSLLVLPLSVRGEVLGTLVLGSEQPGGFDEDVRVILQVLAGHIAVSLANARMVKRLEEMATTDGLTALLNKRALTDAARQKLRAAERFGRPLSVLVCDLDHFKAVNDTHGHDVGDRVIRGFADALRRTKRETDTLGRIGGEEFVVVCEQTDVDGAELLAKRIMSELGTTTFVTPQGELHVTCSIGLATYPEAGKDWESLFKATDEALYASKRGGRDRVTVWSSRLRAVKAG